ncbi:MAG TPA: WD40 repeat domain-containing serine/threonine protein kinase [Kofleriaceae bacterium]|jgi:serine/threonine protein kinase|nr:WD40 repeat domain-containing serine/threonine protein kinase [Kofleriaceae bacterium]
MANNAAHDATGDAGRKVTSATSPEGELRDAMPARVGRYEIAGVLGTGAMGVVYRARDPQLDRSLAIKLVRTDGAGRSRGARLMREAQAMARLRHPNVVPIFDVGLADDAVFVAMPLLEGGTLKSWLRATPRPLDAILDRFVAAGQGLAAAHAAGLVHRDFKPDNVLLGEAGEVQVADFGLARVAHGGPSLEARPPDPASQLGHVVGTPAYMSPEQLRGRPSDARADQFSFCIALWESVYDDRPFGKPSATADPLQARLEAIEAGPVSQHGDRPEWIAEVMARGLAADPQDRWPTMKALLDAIAAHRAPRRRPWRLWLGRGAVGAALGIAAIAVIAWPERPETAPYHLVPLTHRRDLQHAAISPDGAKLAFVQGDALVIRDTELDSEDAKVIVEHGISDSPISWSPDGTFLLVGTESDNALWVESELVDLHGAVRFKVPARGRATFLSSGEVAVTAYRKHAIEIYSLAANSAPIATCRVDGDYAFLWNLLGLPDGTLVAETVNGDSHNLVILRRDCGVRARFTGEPISSIARSDTNTIIALAAGEGSSEILEISLEGVVQSRRRVGGTVDEVLGRRRGIDYVATLGIQTHLDRVHGRAEPKKLLSVSGSASFSLSPDGTTVAWVEGGTRERGRLRLSTVQDLARRGTPLLDNALFAGWSPDGQSLAVLVDDTKKPHTEVIVIDRAGKLLRHLPLTQLDRLAAPVWLSDHRIAAQTEDRTTYRWFDLVSDEQGDVVDRRHGSTYWLARSPRDGMLAMWRNGLPDEHDPAERLWVQPAGGPAWPLRIHGAVQHFLLPSWSPAGELIVRTLDTGAVSRVALDTGELTPVAQLPPIPLRSSFDDHVMTLADGDLLAVEIDLGIEVSAVRSDDAPRARSPDPAL